MAILLLMLAVTLVIALIRSRQGNRDAKEDQTASLTSSLSEKVGTEPEEFSSFSKDAWESFGSDRDWKRLEDLELEIDYKDSEGKETTRQVRLLKYSVNPDLSEAYLRAHCYLRDSWRTFLSTRIGRCVDIETGEIIQDIPKYLKEKYENSTIYFLEKVWNDFSDELSILVYVGKSDGRLTKAEKEVIADYMIARLNSNKITAEDFIKELKYAKVMTKTQFARAIGRMSKLPTEDKTSLLTASRSILATKKKRGALEEDVIPYMSKRLGCD